METQNLIPIMTSNTAPSGQAFGNNNYVGFDYYYAFDNNINTFWSSNTVKTGFIGYKFSQKTLVNKYTIRSRIYNADDEQTSPKQWTFEGSDDNINWTILDTQNISELWNKGEKKEFIINNNLSFIYYRVNISSSYSSSVFPAVSELEMFTLNKYLIKQDSNYYTINSINYDSITNHNFIPLTLNGGLTPNKSDIETFGFYNLATLTNNMIVASDNFKPLDKFNNQFEIKMYKI